MIALRTACPRGCPSVRSSACDSPSSTPDTGSVRPGGSILPRASKRAWLGFGAKQVEKGRMKSVRVASESNRNARSTFLHAELDAINQPMTDQWVSLWWRGGSRGGRGVSPAETPRSVARGGTVAVQNVIFAATCMIRSPAVAVGRPKAAFRVSVSPLTLK